MKIRIGSISFWVITGIILVVLFGRGQNGMLQATYFVSLMLPVIIGTSFIVNQFLIPRYLLTGRTFKFWLYGFYTVILSVYLEIMVILFAYIYLAQYDYDKMVTASTDLLSLTVLLYLIVVIRAATNLYKYNSNVQTISDQTEQSTEKKLESITVRSNRRLVPILLEDILVIESMSDYVKIHLNDARVIITKEKISKLQSELANGFLRVHRSFLVNQSKVDSYSSELLKVGEHNIPIGRTYKSSTMEALK